jgi:hypothetical protein
VAREPDTLAYSFHCSGPLISYTLIANREPSDFTAIDDSGSSAALLSALGAPVPAESFGCRGELPGVGFDCDELAGIGQSVQGTFDTTDPYCGVAADARKKVATRPAAIVQLIGRRLPASAGRSVPAEHQPGVPKPKPARAGPKTEGKPTKPGPKKS